MCIVLVIKVKYYPYLFNEHAHLSLRDLKLLCKCCASVYVYQAFFFTNMVTKIANFEYVKKYDLVMLPPPFFFTCVQALISG